MTESDHQELRVNLEKHRDHGLYLNLAIQIFKYVMESNYKASICILEVVASMNPFFVSPTNIQSVSMIRDCGRTMSLQLCTNLSMSAQALIR